MAVARARAGAIRGPMTHAVANTAFPAPEHDHDLCLEEALARAREAFQSKGLKLTPLRQSVFREIAASHKAIGAFEALVAAGMVHRFESRNAFFACHAGHQMRQLVLACEGCGRVAEADADAVFAAIDSCAERAGFAAKGAVVEVRGLCASCRGEDREPAHASA